MRRFFCTTVSTYLKFNRTDFLDFFFKRCKDGHLIGRFKKIINQVGGLRFCIEMSNNATSNTICS